MVVRKRPGKDVLLGVFVAIGLALLTFSIFVLGRERRVFDIKADLISYFDNVIGLAVGADVQVGGVLIGSVRKIEFSPIDVNETYRGKIRVVLRVSSSMLDFIREDSVARVEGKGLLGDKIINISTGSFDKPPHRHGDEIPSRMPVDLNEAIEKAGRAVDSFADAAEEAKKILSGFIDEGGQKSLAETVKSIRNVALEIEKGEGLVHQIIYDRKAGEAYKSVMVELKEFSKTLNVTGNKLQKLANEIEDGTVSGALTDIRTVTADLRTIVEKVKNGQGTIGKLINDPAPYEKLLGILGGVEESAVLKLLIRNSLKNQPKP